MTASRGVTGRGPEMATYPADETPIDDAVTQCYGELAAVLERNLPLIPPGADRDRLTRALRHLRVAASLPPLHLLR